MPRLVASFAAGLVFGLGLLLAGMANPAKVLGFLDLAGAWDPSLGLVMAGAVAVGSLAFVIAKQRREALLGGPMQLPIARSIDRRLVVGSTVFGIGWGLGVSAPARRWSCWAKARARPSCSSWRCSPAWPCMPGARARAAAVSRRPCRRIPERRTAAFFAAARRD